MSSLPVANPSRGNDADLQHAGGGRDEHQALRSSLPGWPAHSKPPTRHTIDTERLGLERVADRDDPLDTLTPASSNAGRCGAGLLPAVSTTLPSGAKIPAPS